MNPTPIKQHEGKKYLRLVWAVPGTDVAVDPVTKQIGVYVDVYSLIEAFEVACPARAHALKKLLCCGNRGKGTAEQDLVGVLAAVSRAVELQRQRDRDESEGVDDAAEKTPDAPRPGDPGDSNAPGHP